MLGEELVALEVGSWELLLELPDVPDQIGDALAFVGRTGKDDVVGDALFEQTLPVRCCDVSPRILVGLPYLLKSVDGHMRSFPAGSC